MIVVVYKYNKINKINRNYNKNKINLNSIYSYKNSQSSNFNKS
jgi:hypothetical protein